MSHNITVDENGTAEAAFALKPAWHGLGTVLDHPMLSAEALAYSGLGWEVEQHPLAYVEWNGDKSQRVIPVPVLANLRSDNNYFLGTVTKSYCVVQNTEAFEFLDSLIENHEMQYESAFSLSGGKKVVLLARLPQEDTIVKNDRLLRYILLSLQHDGSGAIRFGPTSIRTVCANTYALALTQGSVEEISIRHTGSIRDKLGEARGILQKIGREFDDYRDKSRLLTKHRMSTDNMTEYMEIMCPELHPNNPDYSTRRTNQLNLIRKAIYNAYHN